MRTLDEAIAQAREKAKIKYRESAVVLIDGNNSFETNSKYNACMECAKEHEQIAGWLEELKAYQEIGTVEECRNSVLDIERAYNKAIDDFVEKLKMEYEKYDIDDVFESSNFYSYTNACYIFENYIEKIAEQLKAGG